MLVNNSRISWDNIVGSIGETALPFKPLIFETETKNHIYLGKIEVLKMKISYPKGLGFGLSSGKYVYIKKDYKRIPRKLKKQIKERNKYNFKKQFREIMERLSS